MGSLDRQVLGSRLCLKSLLLDASGHDLQSAAGASVTLQSDSVCFAGPMCKQARSMIEVLVPSADTSCAYHVVHILPSPVMRMV